MPFPFSNFIEHYIYTPKKKIKEQKKITFLRSLVASSSDMGGSRGEMGWQLCWARERAAKLGMRILCSVSTLPRTFSPNLLSISAGKGSLAPKSPSMSVPRDRTAVLSFLSPSRARVEMGSGSVGGS